MTSQNPPSDATSQASQAPVWWLLGVLLLLRLVSLGLYPLMDNTEARYAEMARVMVAMGDWVTPWYDTQVPFWGKPPLSFWTTAVSFGMLGVTEFAARLPHLLAALLVLWLVWGWARRHSPQQGLAALALLAGSSLMLVCAGAVMTDMTLLVGTTLAMRGFWLGLYGSTTERRRERWLFFVGLAVGLLAKGPLVLVLAGLPLLLWTLVHRRWRAVWRALPWLWGSLLTLLLVLPWYALAEMRTPGFLNYFLLGEHWHRFVTPGWTGDRYGVAHAARWGTIWVYAGVAVLPWPVLLPLALWRWRRGQPARPTELAQPITKTPLRLYLLLWALTPLVFFTFAGNILWTYVLPSLPPVALLGARWLSRQPVGSQRINQWLLGGLVASALWFAGFVGTLYLKQNDDWHTTRELVAHPAKLGAGASELFFYPARPYSAAFYSRGHAQQITQLADLQARASAAASPAYVAIHNPALAGLPAALQAQWTLVAPHGEYTLFLIGTGTGTVNPQAP